jgi:hypothetical protein
VHHTVGEAYTILTQMLVDGWNLDGDGEYEIIFRNEDLF